MSGWVATAGGLWSLRLNAPSRWFLASQARMTTCKTKIHRSSLRSLAGAGVGLLVLSVMATSHGADAVPSLRKSRKHQQTRRKTGDSRQTESAREMGKRPPCDKTHGAGATFCPARHQAAPNRMGAAERAGSVLRDVAIGQESGGCSGEGFADDGGKVAVEVDGAGVDGVGGCPRRGSGAGHRGRCRERIRRGLRVRRGWPCGRSRSRRAQTGHQDAPWERAHCSWPSRSKGLQVSRWPRLSPSEHAYLHKCKSDNIGGARTARRPVHSSG